MVLLKQVFLKRKMHKGKAIKSNTVFNFCPDYNGTLKAGLLTTPVGNFCIWRLKISL